MSAAETAAGASGRSAGRLQTIVVIAVVAIVIGVAAFLIGVAFGQLAFGPRSDRLGRRPPLLAGLAVFARLPLATLLTPARALRHAILLLLARGSASLEE